MEEARKIMIIALFFCLLIGSFSFYVSENGETKEVKTTCYDGRYHEIKDVECIEIHRPILDEIIIAFFPIAVMLGILIFAILVVSFFVREY